MQDIPKLCTAMAEWLSCITMLAIYRNSICKKRSIRQFSVIAVTGAGLGGIQLMCGMVSGLLWVMGMAAAVLLMSILLKYGLETEWKISFYLCTKAFMLAEFLAALEWQMYSFYLGRCKENMFLETVFCVIFFVVGYGLFFIGECKVKEKIRIESVNKKNLALVWTVTIIMFTFSNISYTQIPSPFSGMGSYEIFNARTLVDFAGFLMLELFYMQKADWDRMEEMTAIQNILKMQYMQYRESQENIELLNRKYHDLKHQIQIVRDEKCEEKKNEYLREIESGLERYESEIRTGNSVLDTILTSKSNICRKHGIIFTVVADGKLVSYLHVMDLCTIFGNALDNAIEYEVQLEDQETRIIHVNISKKEQFTCIIIENYYEGSWSGRIDLPETTKNKNYHGYGLKSIQYSIKKYGGYLNTNIADNWFRVEMLFPETYSADLCD